MDELNIRKRNPAVEKLLFKNPNLTSTVKLYFSSEVAGDDYDPYENNLTFSTLNPLTIKAYVHDVSPRALVYKQYGLAEAGAKEILCDAKYKDWFMKCEKIEIADGEFYQVYKEAANNRSLITTRPYNMIQVLLSRREY